MSPSNKAKFGSALAVSCLFSSPIVWSEDTVELDTLQIIGDQIAEESYQVDSTPNATLFDTPLKDTPKTVSVVTNAELKDFGLSSLNDALENTNTGVTVESVETDRTYYSARGFRVDNIQIDGQGSPLVWAMSTGQQDMAEFESIEVVRGANGLTNATGFPSASVNLVRKRPTEKFQSSVSASYGSWDQKRLEGDVSGSIYNDGQVRGRLIAVTEGGDSYLDRYGQQTNLVSAILAADLGGSTTLTGGYSFQDYHADSPTYGALTHVYADGTLTDYDISTNTSTDWSYIDVTTQRTFVDVEHNLNDRWKAKAQLSHFNEQSDGKLFYVYQYYDPATEDGYVVYPLRYTKETAGSVADASITGAFDALGQEHKIILGINGSAVSVEDLSEYATSVLAPFDGDIADWNGEYPEAPYTNGTGTADWNSTQLSAYAAAEINLTDKLTALTGIRVISFDSDGDSYGLSQQSEYRGEWVPNLGVTYKLTPELTTYINYTEILKPQFETTESGELLGTLDGKSIEGGLKAALIEDRVQFGLGVFRTQQNNLAEYAGNITAENRSFYEGIDATSQGVELQLTGQVNDHFNVNAGYTYVRIEDADGEQVRLYVPEHSARMSTTYRLPFHEQLKIGANVKWQSEISREIAGVTVKQSAYALLNTSAQYQLAPNWIISANANNITNEKHLTTLEYDQSYYGAPRNYRMSVAWKY